MEKQIEEMAKVLKDLTRRKGIMASHVILEDYAEALYNAGYRKQSEGDWIKEVTPTGFIYYKCSVCGWDFCSQDSMIDQKPVDGVDLKYCPNCGAKMKGEDPK